MHPLRRTIHTYGFIPKRGGSVIAAILSRRSPFFSGPGHNHRRDGSGTFSNVWGPARFLIHTTLFEAPRHPLEGMRGEQQR